MMNIELTNLKSLEIISVLRNYPMGNLQIIGDRIFWSSDYVQPQNINNFSGEYPPRGMMQPRSRNLNQDTTRVVKKMSDALGSMVC